MRISKDIMNCNGHFVDSFWAINAFHSVDIQWACVDIQWTFSGFIGHLVDMGGHLVDIQFTRVDIQWTFSGHVMDLSGNAVDI